VNDPAAKLGNYTVTVTNGTLTVGPAPLVVSGTNATRLYGDPNPTFAGTITGLKNADNITASFASAALVTSAVGSYPIVPTLADPTNKLGNYSVTSNNGTLSVTPAPLSLSAADASRVYGDPNPVFTGSLTGLRNGDAITASFTTTATPASNVGTFAILPSLVDPTGKAGNYSVTATNGTLTITQAPLSVVAGNATRVYGDPNPTFAGTITGLKNNDNITAVYTGVDATSPVGAHPITPSLVDPTGKLPNYSVTSTNGTLTITPAPLTVSANNATRLYGDANPAFTGTITGIKNADNITATFATTAVVTSSIGGFPITPALADPGLKLTNYTVTSTNGTLSVTPAPLTVSGTNASRLYGDPNPAFTGTITGIKNADNITATFASTAVVTSPVGSFAIVPTLADPTAKLGNYSVTSNNGTLTINPATLTVTAADATRIYGDPNPAFSATVAGTKNGDVVTASATSAATAASNVGSYPVVPSAVGAPAVLSNYTVSAVNGSLTVTQAPLSVAAGNATKIYGDPNPAFTGTITGLKNNDNITATFAGVDAASPVGTFPVTPSLVDPTGKLPNYSVTTTNGTLTITPAPLSVSAANATRAYGDPNPTFTGTLTGIKNADNITATFSTTATLTSNVGAFVIVPALADPNLKLGNYTVTSSNGTLTVTAAPLTATGVNATRLYGDANPLLAATISGLKNGDPITASATTTATLLSSVGSFPVIPALSDPTNKLANYAVSLVNGALSITPAPLTVTGNNGTRVYGDANPAFTGTITGLRNADAIVATFSTTATVTSNVGTFPITGSLSPANLLANYSVTQNAGTLTITQSPLTVVAGNASRLYGDANPAFVGTITGLKNGDNITASVSGADPTSAVGSYALVPALVDPTGKLANYSVTSTNGTLTITAAPLAVTAANFSRAYGDPNPSFTGTLVGLKNADAITATFSTVANLTSPIGAFAITPALADPTTKLGNYSVTTTNGTLTVNPAVLTVTGTNATRLYGDANPAFTGTVTGVKNGENITATFATTATPASVVGSYPIVPTPVDPTNKLGNYTVTSVNGALTVSPAPLNVTSADASRAYGDPNPAFTGSVTGLKNGDVITGTFSTTASLTSAVGAYPITATLSDPGTRLGNYSVISTNGTLTVTAVPLSVSAANATRIYGDPNPAFTGTIVGLKNGDNITATFSSAGPTSAIGTYPIVPSLVDPTAKLGNYTVTANNGTLTVTVASITVTAANTSRPYGSNNPVLTGSLVGVKNADPITAVFTTAADPTSPVGTYPIVASLLDPSSKLTNYTVTAVNATLSVVQATPAVTVAAQVGTANTVLTATVANVGAILPTGTVQFFDGANAIGQLATLAPPSPGAAPQASVTVTLATGSHSISAKYAGDSTYTSASAAAVNVIISAGAVFAFDGTGGNTSATVSAGQNATYKLSLAPQGFSGTIALSCSGAPAGTTCAVSPNSVDVTATSGSVPVTVTVSNTQNARLHVPGFGNTFVFAGVFAGLLVGFRRKRTQFLLVLLAGLLVTGMTACGGGGGNNGGTPPRNPTNATLTLTGTSGSQSASINLSLTITH
jgi:hypothetical protein